MLYRACPQGCQACRLTDSAADHVRVRYQPQDCPGTRDHTPAWGAGHCRRGDRMRRREFITLLGSATATWPHAARAQQPERMRRIGVLLPATTDDPQFQTWVGAFLRALALLGWTIGRTVRIDTRW